MSLTCVTGATMNGSVPHHAGHIIGYKTVVVGYSDDGEGNSSPIYGQEPIYCSGHSVTGSADKANQSKMFVGGKAVLVKGASGQSNDACDGSRFVITGGSSKVFIGGIPVVLSGHSIELNPGSGNMDFPNQSKMNVSR